MKKIIRIVFAVLILCTLCLPAMARNVGMVSSASVPAGNYDSISIMSGTLTKLDLSNVSLRSDFTLSMQSDTQLTISNGVLTGQNATFLVGASNVKILLEGNAGVDVTISSEISANEFFTALQFNASGVDIRLDGKRVYTFKCQHEDTITTTTTRTVCTICNKVISENAVTLPENATLGSTISEGNMAIIVGVAAAVVFGLGGFLVGKKNSIHNS